MLLKAQWMIKQKSGREDFEWFVEGIFKIEGIKDFMASPSSTHSIHKTHHQITDVCVWACCRVYLDT